MDAQVGIPVRRRGNQAKVINALIKKIENLESRIAELEPKKRGRKPEQTED